MCITCVKIANSMKSIIDDENETFCKRKRKLNINDAILYRLLYTQKNKSQQNVVSILNSKNNKHVNRSNYSRREAKIELDTYKKLYDIITKYENHYYYDKYTYTVYAVDGTDSNMQIKLSDSGYKANKNNESVTSLSLGVYNVTRNYPVSLEMVKHKNERKAFLDFLKNKHIRRRSIYIFDRGFFSYEVVNKLCRKNLNFVFRIKQNSILLNQQGDDYEIDINHNGHNQTLRIIKYKAGENEYYLATNLFDTDKYTVEKFKELYHSRWTVEEYFKLVKSTMKLSKFDETTEASILKSIYCQLLLTKLSALLEQCYNNQHLKNDTQNKKVNRSNLIHGLYSEFIMNIFYKRTFKRDIVRFMKLYIVIHNSKKNRSFERTCKTPYHKWYIKRYFKKYIKLDTSTIDDVT